MEPLVNPRQAGERWTKIVDWGLVAAVVFLVVLVFLPGVNPARISEKVSRNLSLFTSGLFYDSLTGDMGRLLAKGWVPPAAMLLAFWSSFAACVGVGVVVAGACLSLGNRPLQRRAFWFFAAGAGTIVAAMGGIGSAYDLLVAAGDPAKALPLAPGTTTVFVALALGVGVLALVRFLGTPRRAAHEKGAMGGPQQLFLMLLPFLVLVFVFSYLPLWGWRYGFFHYQPGDQLTADKFAGWAWFTFLFENSATTDDLVRVVVNTLAMSGLGILTSWVPLVFAVFLSEIRSNRFRRTVQTLTTIPNFISWVLVYAVAFCIFSTDGFLSSLMVQAGVWTEGKNLLMGDDQIWLKMLAWGLWKGLGWGAILYIAAITAIDPQLYEAATVDGAGRFQKMWHVTVPELVPTFMVLLLLSIAGILNNGMEQYLVFENSSNTGPITVLDLYVYKLGIGQGHIPLSTVVGMVKSLISVALLFGANALSKLIRGTSIV